MAKLHGYESNHNKLFIKEKIKFYIFRTELIYLVELFIISTVERKKKFKTKSNQILEFTRR